MTASLPMYDLPEVRWATDIFAGAVLQRLNFSAGVTRGGDHAAAWGDPALVFSQTCGYPLTHALAGQVRYVATPHYRADGCDGPLYCSLVLARERLPLNGFRGARAAVNASDSMSGMLGLKLVFAPLSDSGDFFAETKLTGSHLASLASVRAGHADVCAIDAVTVAMARRHAPENLSGLVEVARSPHVPGLPYITRARAPSDVASALSGAFADNSVATAREALLLDGFSVLPADAYDIIPRLEATVEDFKLL